MTRVLIVAVVLAQLLDYATWALMPQWAESNPLIRDMHTDTALLVKGALVVLVLALQPALRPKYSAVGDLLAVVAIVVGCLGAGSNLAVLSSVNAAETPRSVPEPAPIASEATGIEQGTLVPAAPARIPAPRLVRHEPPDIPRGTQTLRGIASWVRASLGPRYLAARMPKGTALRVCGPIGCTSGTVNDYGPRKSVFPGRIVDLSRARFAAVCGDPERLGTCPVRVSRLAPLQLPATDR